MTTRAPALLVALGGALMAALPTLPWYTVSVNGREADASGIGAAGQLWVLPVLGAAALAAGVALAAAPAPAGSHRARVVATVAGVAGAVGILWALVAVLDPPVRLSLPDAGLPGPVAASVEVAPAAYVTLGACATVLLTATGLARVRVPWDRLRAHFRSPRRR